MAFNRKLTISSLISDVVNLCLAGAIDPDVNAEITVVNIGNDVSGSDQFACLVSGGTGSPNYNEYDLIDGALDDLEHLEKEICKELTPEQTPEPTLEP